MHKRHASIRPGDLEQPGRAVATANKELKN